MTLRDRILIMVTALLVFAVMATAFTLTWTARQALLSQMEADGKVITQLLARSAAFAAQVPGDVEQAIGEQMVVEATIAAHMIAVAEAAGLPPEEINQRLRQITENSTLDEFWITDEEGHAYLRNQPIDFTFSPDALEQPQAHEFWSLLTGESAVVEQEARVREVDQQIFKYVGVSGVDQPRIVQVGYHANFLSQLAERFGVTRLTQELISGGDIIAIRVMDGNFLTLAYSAIPEANTNPEMEQHAQELMLIAVQEKRTVSDFFESILQVVAPVIDDDNRVIGATIVFLPTDHVQTTARQQIQLTALVAGIVLITGILTSIVLSRRQTEPVERITRAAKDVENGDFTAEVLASVRERQDELGKLAQIFTSMAIEVQTREQRLRRQVEALRIEVDESKKELQVAEITESEYFHNLQEKVQELRSRKAEEIINSERKSNEQGENS